ncbi:MAG: DUF2490 domain-containing protein [Candidatus Neomarinimicrobiota bacterium]
MIKKFFLSSLFWLLIFLPQFIFGVDDFESWSSIGFEKKLPYSFSFSFKQGLRLKNQLATFKQTHSEGALSYQVFNNIKIEIPYRYIVYKDKIKQRLSISGSQKYNMKSFILKHRIKYQMTSEIKETLEDLIRNKVYILYQLNKRLEPFISGEIFHFHEEAKYQFDEYRLTFGINIDFPKKQSFKISYMFKSEDLNKEISNQINIFAITYNYKW